MLGGGYELLLILVYYSATSLLAHQSGTGALTLTVTNGLGYVIAQTPLLRILAESL